MRAETQTIAIVAGLAALWWLVRRSRTPIASVTTSETFELAATDYPEGLSRLAEAIANAEGFYAGDTLPRRANNPGDLKLGGETIGGGITVFDSADAGWAALKRQLGLILTGASRYYSLDMPLSAMAATWTATEQSAWASNVASYLGVSPETPLATILLES